MALIGKNPLTSVTSLKNLEMSQHSSDVAMLVNFPIYISLLSSLNSGADPGGGPGAQAPPWP